MENLGDIFQYVVDNNLSFTVPDAYRIGDRMFVIVRDKKGNIETVKYKNHYTYIDFDGIVAKNLAVMLDSKYKANIAHAIQKTPRASFKSRSKENNHEYILTANGLEIVYNKNQNGRRIRFGRTQIRSKSFGHGELSGENSRQIIRLCERIMNTRSKKER